MNLDIQRHMLWSFFMFNDLRWKVIWGERWFEVRGGCEVRGDCEVRGHCSFCWYWWKCWSSLYKLTFYNHNSLSSVNSVLSNQTKLNLYTATYREFYGLNLIQPTISLEMPVPSQGHYGFHSFPVVDWFCLFI